MTLAILNDAGSEEDGVLETSTKNHSTQRRVPVHSALVALGFDDYVQRMRGQGAAALFPDIVRAVDRPAGEYFSDWFSAYRKAQGIAQRYLDFHAFRHTVRTRLTDAGVEDVISSALMGHTSGSTGRRVYDHSTATLRPALDKLQFPELSLKRCYQPL
jgi:integrase